jgi:D-alanyl-D-alanine carboxypeptidase/D-alanyl-D-alanine-endopeptidase (penicillin-binding protein 4)
MPNRASIGIAWVTVAAVSACAGRGVQSPEPAEPTRVAEERQTPPLEALRTELDEFLADPAFYNAHWGVMVQSLENGQVLYRHNERKLFIPASNMKLLTSSVALARLGAEHRFRTHVSACGTVDGNGVLTGDLVVKGGGDPSISDRFHNDDPVGVFRAWADSLRDRGVSRIDGRVVGDDDLFDDVHIGPGWAWDYLDAAYAAEIGALLLNEGAAGFVIKPGESIGSAASVTRSPDTSYLDLLGAVATTADSTGVTVRASREPFSNDAELTGRIWIGTDSVVRYIAPHDPTMYFVTVLTETLEADGIEIGGTAVDRDDLEDLCESPVTLFVHQSPPLGEILQSLLKESQNQIGEMLLRYLGAVETDLGSISAGRRVVTATLTSWGIPDDSYIYYDGSGLSRYNYVAPEAVVRLLRRVHQRPEFDVFFDALPIAGVDGTLRNRMKGTNAEDNARAKTGFIANARALSGYVTTADGELLAFSIITNNFDTPVRPVEYVQDLIVERLANFER